MLSTDRVRTRLLMSTFLGGILLSVALHAAGVGAILPGTREVSVAFETTTILVASLATFLVIGRYVRRPSVDDVYLVVGLGLMAMISLWMWLGPILPPTAVWDPEAWELSTLRTAVGVLLALGAWLPQRSMQDRALAVWGWAVTLPLVLMALLVVAATNGWTPRFGASTDADADTLTAVLEASGAVAFLAAAVGMWRHHRHADDVFIPWLAAALGAYALARANFAVVPSVYTDEIRIGDIFRLLALALLVVGPLREISVSWQRNATVAVNKERRRIARELHDGVAQEVSFILSATRSMGRDARTPEIALIEQAAERALDDARTAVVVLSHEPSEPLDQVLLPYAEHIASRRGAVVHASCEPGIKLPLEATRGLLGILREAVSNAVVHGGASRIEVDLSRGRDLVLRVSDDGGGFEVDRADGSRGFGLTSMTERAALIGGELRVESAPGSGTTVEVRL